jgi:integrase/recombinase XerD
MLNMLELRSVGNRNGVRISSRNVRLAAVRSLFTFAVLRHPEHPALIGRLLAIPAKRAERAIVCFLSPEELDALVQKPDDRAGLGGATMRCWSLPFRPGCVSPSSARSAWEISTSTRAAISAAQERGGSTVPRRSPAKASPAARLSHRERRPGRRPGFPRPGGFPLGRDAIRRLVERHAATAARRCSSLALKKPTPHVLRHTYMRVLERPRSTSMP